MATTSAPTRGNGQAKPAAQQQTQPAAKPAQDPHVETGKKVLESALDREITYKPFLSETPIKLSARLVLAHLCTPTKLGKLCTESQAIRFMMLCRSRGLDPWQGDAYIVGYDTKDGPVFSLVTAHQAYLKRAEVHPEYDGMESGVVVKREGAMMEYQGDMVEPGDVLIGAWARIHFKKRATPIYRRALLADIRKPFGIWTQQPSLMAVKTVEADALRSAFPNQLGGMYLEGRAFEGEAAASLPAPSEVQPGRGADAHPEPPPFDRAGCIRSIATQNTEAVKSGLLTLDAFPKMLATFNAAKLDDLTDEQLQQVEAQVAAVFATTDPDAPRERQPGEEE